MSGASQHKFPALHNAMWPGLVGKGPDSEPPIDLDTMLDLTANASVDGVRFDGVDLFLFDPHVSIDATDADLKRLADKIASKGFVVGSLVAPVWPPTGGGSAMGSDEDRKNAKLPLPPNQDSQVQVLLRPGLLADVQIEVEKIPDALHVPAQAVFNRNGKYMVFVQQKGKTYEGLAKMLLLGSLLMAIAVGWDLLLPINKKLWTSSYVLYTVGIDMIFLSFLLYIIEFRQKTSWTAFFNVFGKNPLFIYMLSELLVVVLFTIRHGRDESLFEWINKSFYQALVPGAFGSLLFALTYMLLCWAVGKWLDAKKIYIRV